MKLFGSRFCCCLQERKAPNLVDPFDRSILTHPVTEDVSIEGVYQIRCFFPLKMETEPYSETPCFISNLVDGQRTKKEGYIKNYTAQKTYVSFSNLKR
jgi:hypothetical protein